jgi:hypothetical protein
VVKITIPERNAVMRNLIIFFRLIEDWRIAIIVLMTYLLYIKSDFLNWRNIVVFSLAGSLAANTKFLLVPTVGIFFSLAIVKIIITAIRQSYINLKNIMPIEEIRFNIE